MLAGRRSVATPQRRLCRSRSQASARQRAPEARLVSPLEDEGMKLMEGQEPKRFNVGKGMGTSVFGNSVSAILRGGGGAFALGYRRQIEANDDTRYSAFRAGGWMLTETSKVDSFPRPEQPLQIYEFQSCPFCLLVREAVTYLDLDVLMLPCPRNGKTYRPQAEQIGGKQQFPFLIDPNTGKQMYESKDIVNYLASTYGDGSLGFPQSAPGGMSPFSALPSALTRLQKGREYEDSHKPEKPLKLWSYEVSPFCKPVRERLVELEVPHLLVSCARGSPKREAFYEKLGRFQVPYLEDPNTNTALFESGDIIDYLDRTYKA